MGAAASGSDQLLRLQTTDRGDPRHGACQISLQLTSALVVHSFACKEGRGQHALVHVRAGLHAIREGDSG